MAVATAGRLKGIDTVRAMAALLVALGHDLHFVNELPGKYGGGITIPLFQSGLGANLLLFVAGFMSVYVAWNRFGQPRQSLHYLKRRAIRLVPLYWFFTTAWLVIALGVPSLVTHAAPKLGHIVASYAFIPYAREDGLFNPILALGWTMNFIFLFDLITGLAIRFSRPAALAVILCICSALLLLHPLTEEGSPFYFWTGRFLLLYAAGAIVAFIYRGQEQHLAQMRIGGLTSLVLLCVLSLASFRYLDEPFSLNITANFICVCGIAIVMGLVAIVTRETSVNMITVLRDKIAAASYSVYLTHPFTLGVSVVMWKKLGLYQWLPGGALLCLALLAILVVAYIVHMLVEMPLTRWLEGALRERDPSGTPVSQMA